MLIFVTDDFAVDPIDVSSLEKYDVLKSEPSGTSYVDGFGTIVIQKNGRKTYLKGLTVKTTHELIFGKEAVVLEETKMLTHASGQSEEQGRVHQNDS